MDHTGGAHSLNSALSWTASASAARPTPQATASGQNESNFGSHLPASLRTWGEHHVRRPPSIAYGSSDVMSRNVTNSSIVAIKDRAVVPHVQNRSGVSPSSTTTVSGESEAARRDRQMALLHANLKDSVLKSGSLPSSTDRHSVPEKPPQPCVPASLSPDTTASSDAQLVMCECDFGPVDQGTLERHIMTAHVKPFSHSCELCDRKFLTRKELRDHVTCHIRTCAPAEPEGLRGLQQDSESTSFVQECDSLSGVKEPRSAAGENRGAYEKRLDDNATETGYHWRLRPDLVGSDCLLSFYKCTVGQCRFTANRASDFSNHLASHRFGEMGELVCIYCGEKFDAISVLVQHMEGAHRHMVFQCGYCLYRAVLPIHVQLHHQWSHVELELLLLVCTNPARHAAHADIPIQRVSLTHYWCSVPNCNFKSFNPDVFEWHLSSTHPKAKEYICSICDTPAGSPRQLVQHHCVDHGMDVVQCGICHHSEPTCERMLKHLCNHHPDSPLGLICRTNHQVEEFEKCVQSFQGSDERPVSRSGSSPELSNRAVSSSAVLPDASPTSQSSPLAPAVKTCPFCPNHVVTLAELANHCVAAHQIRCQISDILELILKNRCVPTVKERSLSCPFCSATFLNKDALQEHIYYEFHYMPIQCEACSYSTTNKVHLKEHFSSSHAGKFPMFKTCENDDFESWVTKFVSQQEDHCVVIEKPYQCVECTVRFESIGGLRLHLYTHLKYYPYHCSICDECFISQEEVEEHQRKKHHVAGQYSIKQVRFETKEMKIDHFIDTAVTILHQLLDSSLSQQCLWKGCTFESLTKSERDAHMKGHVGQRNMCTRCQFSSYSADVIAWHGKEQHSPVSSSTEAPPCSDVQPVPKNNSRLFACGLCNYRGPNTMSIREHSKIAHPGKAVKLVVPKRKDLYSPAVKSVEQPGRSKEEDGEERLTISLVRPQKDTTRLSRWSLNKQKLPCNQCKFVAWSEHLLHSHKSNFHGDGQSLSAGSDIVANALSNALTLATRQYSMSASSISQRSSQSACQLDTSAPGLPQSDHVYTCRKCSAQFQSKTSFFNHLLVKHHAYALCDTCGCGLMNNAQAINHAKKHPTSRSTFTVLRRKLLTNSPTRNLKRDIPTTKQLQNASDLYVVAPGAPDVRVPLQDFSLQHNLNVRVRVKDFGKCLNNDFK
uniref:Crooked legs n=1 Tax=Rhipicephalus zambeziensis TaxID=60191 RepID=A0A224YUW4_9ACAR